jgi:uncharacterized protein (TIGR02246 family)
MTGPLDTVEQLMKAINRADVEAAVALYERDAVLVVEPGRLARGPTPLRDALAGFIALKPTLQAQAQQVLEVGDVALYLGRWSLQGTDPAGKAVVMNGESTDILRRQPDGRWLITLDNPWGVRLLANSPG